MSLNTNNVLLFVFAVLENKAPKAEDIDEEDDDVPGMDEFCELEV